MSTESPKTDSGHSPAADFYSPTIRLGRFLLDHNLQRVVVDHYLLGLHTYLTEKMRENMANLSSLGHAFTPEEWARVSSLPKDCADKANDQSSE